VCLSDEPNSLARDSFLRLDSPRSALVSGYLIIGRVYNFLSSGVGVVTRLGEDFTLLLGRRPAKPFSHFSSTLLYGLLVHRCSGGRAPVTLSATTYFKNCLVPPGILAWF